MNKSLKKILVTGASLLMFASVGTGVNNLVKPARAHSLTYKFWHTPTGKLYHGITLGGHYYPAGTKLYNANYATGSYGASMGPSPYSPRYIIPAWARKKDHTHHYHHRKVLYQYQIRPHYNTKTYNRLLKKLTREMKAHGAYDNKHMATLSLKHNGRLIELTGTNTGVVTNGLKGIWPDQGLNLLHKMYRHKPVVHKIHRLIRKSAVKKAKKASRRVNKFRKAHKHIRRTRKVRVQSNRHRHSQQSPIKQNCYELNQQTLSDINQDRRRHHLRGLKLDGQLSQIGSQRSHQLQHYFSHNTPQHADEVQYLLNQKHVNYEYYGENISSSPLGTISMIAVGRYSNPHDASHNKLIYHAHNGYQLANNIEDASMNHDEGDQNGHRANILDKQFKRIGVGSSYDSHDRNYYAAIEFIS